MILVNFSAGQTEPENIHLKSQTEIVIIKVGLDKRLKNRVFLEDSIFFGL